MRLKVLIAAAFSAAWASCASAAPCPENALGNAMTLGVRVLEARDGSALIPLSEIATNCPNDGRVQYIAAVGLTSGGTSYAPNSVEAATLLPLAFIAYAKYRTMIATSQPITVAMPDGSFRPLSMDSEYDMAEALVKGLLASERATKIDLISPVLKAVPDYCPISNSVQITGFDFKAKGPTKGGLALADKAVACEPASRDKHIFRARVLLNALSAEPDRIKRRATIVRIREDVQVGLGPQKSNYFWGSTEAAELDRAELDATDDPPEALWFTKEYIGKPETQRAIAKKLDLAWPGDILKDSAKAYRDVIGAGYSAAMQSPDFRGARLMVYRAALDHAEGRVRRPESKDFKAPPGFLYNWVNPDQPKPTP